MAAGGGDVARAVATAARQASPSRPLAVIGRDPRASGEMLEAAVAAGLASAGVDVVLLGVLPTPAVAFLTADMGADLGVVISASHNAMPDNGIKIFAAGGLKLDDAVEDAIEAPDGRPWARCRPARESAGSGRAVDADRRYLDHLLIATPNPLERAAGGGRLRARRGVRSRARGVSPGRRRGGRHRRQPGRAEHQRRCRVRPTCRGCAQRWCPSRPIWASPTTATPTAAWRSPPTAPMWTATSSWRCWRCRCATAAELVDDTVVATVMANIGFHQAMAKAGITVRTTAVGDRYVLEEMRAGGLLARRRAVGAPDPGRPRHHRRRPALRVAPDGRGRRCRSAAGRTGHRGHQVPAGADQCPGRRQGSRRVAPRCAGSGGQGRGGTGRLRPGAAAAVRHRVAGPGDGRGRHRRRRADGSPSRSPRSSPGSEPPVACELGRLIARFRARNARFLASSPAARTGRDVGARVRSAGPAPPGRTRPWAPSPTARSSPRLPTR